MRDRRRGLSGLTVHIAGAEPSRRLAAQPRRSLASWLGLAGFALVYALIVVMVVRVLLGIK